MDADGNDITHSKKPRAAINLEKMILTRRTGYDEICRSVPFADGLQRAPLPAPSLTSIETLGFGLVYKVPSTVPIDIIYVLITFFLIH